MNELNEVDGGTSYSAGYATGQFVAKTIIAVGTVAGLYALLISA
ncbi:hypothetical protein [Xanthomonas theicola]|nr:hypothetical protein [Xanthomonas theicola]